MLTSHQPWCALQIFDRSCPYIASDSVFATKDDLVVDFVGGPEADKLGCKWQLQYDIHLVKES